MAKRGNLPTKAELNKLAAGLKPGKRVKAFNGITMTVDFPGATALSDPRPSCRR